MFKFFVYLSKYEIKISIFENLFLRRVKYKIHVILYITHIS